MLATVLASRVGAAPDTPMLDLPMAYVLHRGSLETSLYVEKINDTLDVFDVKESQVSGLSTHQALDLGSLGDLDGLRGLVNLGLGDRATFRYEGQFQKLKFGQGTLDRDAHEFALRWSVLDEKGRRPALSLEPIYRTNRGSGIRRSFDRLDAFGFVIVPRNPITFEFGGVGDETLALRLLASKRTSSRLLCHGWLELASTDVTSELHTSLNVQQLQDIVGAIEYSQSHTLLGLGLSWRIAESWRAGLSLEHYWLDRNIDASIAAGRTENDVVHGRLSRRVFGKSWVTLDAKYFDNQFLGEVPFLYNRFTASRFDKHYGYVGLGVTVPLEFGS